MDSTSAPEALAAHGFTGSQIREITREGMRHRRRRRFSLYTVMWLEMVGNNLEVVRDVRDDLEYFEMGGES
jgi:hypothetical protein